MYIKLYKKKLQQIVIHVAYIIMFTIADHKNKICTLTKTTDVQVKLIAPGLLMQTAPNIDQASPNYRGAIILAGVVSAIV